MKSKSVCVAAAGLACLLPAAALAQSGSAKSGSAPRPMSQGSDSIRASQGRALPSSDARMTGSSTKANLLALDGYCAVCLVEMKEWIAGSPQHQLVFDGRTYRFPEAKQAAMFRAEPAKYLPALGGDDIVEYARAGRRTPGKLVYGATYQGHNYFFASAENKQVFAAGPERFVNADLAMNGACVVCRVDLNATKAGSESFVAVHNGLRYQFVGATQRDRFVANPAPYVSMVTRSANANGSRSRPSFGSGSPGSGNRTPMPSGSGSGSR